MLSSALSPVIRQRLLIKNGTLIDGSGGEPVPNSFLVVEGNRITLVGEIEGSMQPETPDDRLIDATGKFILPTPRRRILPMTASAQPSKGWRSRVTITESGKSRRWVVCRPFFRLG
jgi:hypothetical protein